MATVPHPVGQAYVLKTATVLIQRDGAADVDDFSDHVGEITLTPTSSSGSWTAVNGKVISDQSVSTWAATLGLVQDLDSSGLLRYLLTHEGEKADVVATLADGADDLNITVTLSPATIGGQPGANPLASSVTLPMDGRPEFTPAA